MVNFNDLEKDKVVPKVINKNTNFRNKSSYNNIKKFNKFSISIKYDNYVWKYCVKSEIEMMMHECTKLIFPSFNQNVGFIVYLKHFNSIVYLWSLFLHYPFRLGLYHQITGFMQGSCYHWLCTVCQALLHYGA